MRKLRALIVLLAFALLIQNTCPMGAAGKSTVVSACGQCALKYSGMAPPDGKKNLVTDSSSMHFPLYVFSVQKCMHTFQLVPIMFVRPLLANSYEDVLPHELLRPPRA